MKSLTALFLASALLLTVTACSSSAASTSEAESSGYTVEVEELDVTAFPEDYPLIPADDFAAAFEELKAANLSGDATSYQDVADMFGVDGAYYVNNDYDAGGVIFEYHGWYADNDTNVVVTFEVSGDNLDMYAYTGNGIS
ncbi:hypothetical protein CLV85_1257 [Salinibacterium amurskyense]|uniref:DUF3887 domain-containing protein n=1 Tax=Salinibacterium amurskyense TaxID=205941 RepID=A0A2M9D8N7_9MICO|nr:hypothetical protein CLV85_1257 [Salinibacterium amurskyense]GHD78302.1 hypothetical protein GCM10007394_05660 [Salinibacterium amurskyense]